MNERPPFPRPLQPPNKTPQDPVEGGRENLAKGSLSPFASSVPPLHPGISLLTYLSFIVFFITTRRLDWKITTCLWTAALLFSWITCPRVQPLLKKMGTIFPFLFLALILHALFTPGTILFHAAALYVTQEGLLQGLWITQKLAAFFWLSFAITASVPSLFLFQGLGYLKRTRLFLKVDLGSWIITLFLVTRWLTILPSRWKRQLAEAIKSEPGTLKRTLKGLQSLPRILGDDLTHIHQWIDLLILRGYAEGVLWIAEAPLPRLTRKDISLFFGLLVAWGAWMIYLFCILF